jgi:ribosomal protein L24
MSEYIKAHDRVKAARGHFEGKRGYVTRTRGDRACVVWKGVWDHGIWTELSDLKRTKRYKKENHYE